MKGLLYSGAAKLSRIMYWDGKKASLNPEKQNKDKGKQTI
jgi:hypothetical protein